ncbi:MAG: SgcJ/EcaC family oxidoreductase [Planctomycetota bacterium]
MRRHWILGLVLVAACSTPQSDPEADRAKIDRVLTDWATAWKVKDPVLATAAYSEDAELINAFGFRSTGQPEIEAYLTEVFGMDFVMAGETSDPVHEVRFSKPDVAIVWSRNERSGQLNSAGESLPTRRTSHLRVLERHGDEWQIVSHLISDARDTSRPDH